jgi:hypothetical protein
VLISDRVENNATQRLCDSFVWCVSLLYAFQGQMSAVHWAARQGSTECIRLLISRGANVWAQSREGFTALHFAAMNGRDECLHVILDSVKSETTTLMRMVDSRDRQQRT